MEKIAPVLLVVDVQNGFLNDQSRPALDQIAPLMDECSRRAIPIVCTRFVNLPGSPFETLIGWHKVRHAPETDLHPLVSDRALFTIVKQGYTAFTAEFQILIERNRWDTILICGLSTESCVLKTAVDAFELNLRPLVVADACASDLGGEMHTRGLDVLKVLIGEKQLTDHRSVFPNLGYPTGPRA